jgi:predicted nucleic acid-binding protein
MICPRASPSAFCQSITIAERWDELMAQSRRSGVALFAMDGFFAATTLANNLDAGHAQPQRFRVIRRRAVQPMGRMSFVELHRLK